MIQRGLNSLRIFLLFFFVFLLSPHVNRHARAQLLTLEDYQSQVKQAHQGFQGASQKAQGSQERSVEGDLLFAPSAFTELSRTDDKRPTISAAFQGNQTITEAYSLGVSQQTRFGLTGKVSYNLQHTVINGVNSALVPQNDFFNSGVGLEVTQPLWKNGFGRQVRLQETLLKASASSTSYNEKYNASLILAESEARYWRVAVARELVRLQNDSYERSRRIKDWQERRVKQGLIDDADYLQANAALKMRQLDQKVAWDEETLAIKAFNEYRNEVANAPVPELALPDPDRIEVLSVPDRVTERNDVVSARYNLQANQANLDINRDKQLPTFDVFASTLLSGRDPVFMDSAGRSFTTRNPLYTVGLRVSVPLAFGDTSSVRSGYLKEIQGAELTFQRRMMDQENDWTNLIQQFHNSKQRLKIALELEKAQNLKLKTERDRFKQGRSTTYQISLFEQDYVSAQLSRVQALSQVLNLRAQMKTFEAGEL